MSVSLSSERSVREAYEADASGLHLVPDLVARPESIGDVIEVLRKALSDRIPITCAGAQTSTIANSRSSLRIAVVLLDVSHQH